MSKYNCSVFSCLAPKLPWHRFPNPETNLALFMEWLRLCNNNRLIGLDLTSIYKNYRVCHSHFLDSDFTTKNKQRFSSYTIPTLNMGIAPLNVNIIDDGNAPANIEPFESRPINIDFAEPSCSREHSDTKPNDFMDLNTSMHSPTYISDIEEPTTPIPNKSSLLSSVDVSRSLQLTPKARKLYKTARRLKQALGMSRKRTISMRSRLRNAEKFNNHIDSGLLGEEAINFCLSQLKKRNTKPRGRRYSTDEKVMALSVYKQSGKGYEFLRKMFALPSRQTIMSLLNALPIKSGINDVIFKQLKRSASKMKNQEKHCILAFDEMAVMPNISFCRYSDKFIGLEDFGDRNRMEFADHVLVFKLRGVFRKWQQSLGYVFSHSATKSADLVRLIKLFVTKVQNCGLNIVATVCDQGASNQSAINYLLKESKQLYITKRLEVKRKLIINNKEIIPLYDIPHLIKGIRNNLLKRDLVWKKSDGCLTAKWQDIVNAYIIDGWSGDLRGMHKLTDQHVIPNKIHKMKVAYCTQVLSHSVASFIHMLAQNKAESQDKKVQMEERASETAKIINFFDKLFDSLNGGTLKPHPGKLLRGGVTKTSGHLHFCCRVAAVRSVLPA